MAGFEEADDVAWFDEKKINDQGAGERGSHSARTSAQPGGHDHGGDVHQERPLPAKHWIENRANGAGEHGCQHAKRGACEPARRRIGCIGQDRSSQ